jgi:hypothetical protein
MDPTIEAVKIQDSFSRSTYHNKDVSPTWTFSLDESLDKSLDKSRMYRDINLSSEWSQLQNTLKAYSSEKITEAFQEVDPFQKIRMSIFTTKEALQLANIDAVIDFTSKYKRRLTTDEVFKFATLYRGLGTFQYLQHRKPNARGYGLITKTDEKLNFTGLNEQNLKITSIPDDIFTNWETFIKDTLEYETDGLDLVLSMKSENYLTQSITALRLCKEGGNFIIKVNTLDTTREVHWVQILTNAFKRVSLFRPVTASTNINGVDRFLICKNRNKQVENIISSLTRLKSDTLKLQKFSISFGKWIISQNNNNLEHLLQRGKQAHLWLKEKIVRISEFYLYKCLTLWNIPDSYEIELAIDTKKSIADSYVELKVDSDIEKKIRKIFPHPVGQNIRVSKIGLKTAPKSAMLNIITYLKNKLYSLNSRAKDNTLLNLTPSDGSVTLHFANHFKNVYINPQVGLQREINAYNISLYKLKNIFTFSDFSELNDVNMVWVDLTISTKSIYYWLKEITQHIPTASWIIVKTFSNFNAENIGFEYGLTSDEELFYNVHKSKAIYKLINFFYL